MAIGIMLRSGVLVVGAAVCTAALVGCGSSHSAGPDGAVRGYLNAIASDNGRKACDLLTIDARAEIVSTADTADCPKLVDEIDGFLGSDAGRLKNTTLAVTSQSDTAATVTAALDGHRLPVSLTRQDGSWRIATTEIVNTLIGIPRGS